MKQIIVKNIKIVSIVITTLLLQSCFFYKWHEEKYTLEGSREHLVSGYKPATKEYFIANKKIYIGVYSQTSQHKSFFWGTTDIQKGPYTLGFTLTKGYNSDSTKAVLWNVKMKSNLGTIYSVEETLPLKFKESSVYASVGKKKKYEVCWRCSLKKKYNFNFKRKEIIYVTLDIEVIKDGVSKREEKTLKLIPIIDKDLRFVLPGMPGADT